MFLDLTKMTQKNTAGHTAVSWHSAIAKKFDATYRVNRSFQERRTLWTDLIARHATPGGRALDLGCGSGVFTFQLAAKCREVVAVDGSGEMLDLCREKGRVENVGNVSFIQSDIAEIEKNVSGGFDLIICSSVIEYLDDVNSALGAMHRLLKPGGILMISCPNRQSLFRKVEPWLHKTIGRPRYYRFVKNVLTCDDMTGRVRRLGFNVLETHFFGHTKILSPLMRGLGVRQYSDNLFALVVRK